MSVGKPIVVTRCGVEHVVTDGVTALIADNENLDSIYEKLTQLISNSEWRHSLGRSAREEAVSKWSFSTMSNNYLSNYTQLKNSK
jgi:glycosyltransferase involved in cell wall biosynthesis